jgi:hypothetical protein
VFFIANETRSINARVSAFSIFASDAQNYSSTGKIPRQSASVDLLFRLMPEKSTGGAENDFLCRDELILDSKRLIMHNIRRKTRNQSKILSRIFRSAS